MASQAFERAMKKLESPRETQLAELIMRDITQLSEDAKGEFASGDLLLFVRPWYPSQDRSIGADHQIWIARSSCSHCTWRCSVRSP